MSNTPKNSLTKKHWFGYMFGDWGGCMTFALPLPNGKTCYGKLNRATHSELP